METLLLLSTTTLDLLMKLAANSLLANIGFALSVMGLTGPLIGLAVLVRSIKG